MGALWFNALEEGFELSDGQFWVTVEQLGRLEPHLPRDTLGKPRMDDRGVISGLLRVLKSVGRWAGVPPVKGPRKTLYNRSVCWAAMACGRTPCMPWRPVAHPPR
jgi:hypothetical protein